MCSLVDYAKLYVSFHKKAVTKYLEMVAVPFLLLAGLIGLSCIYVIVPRYLSITLADIFVVALLVFYFLLNWRLALAVLPIVALLLWVAHLISMGGPTRVSAWCFVLALLVGGVIQACTYFIEGRAPALKSDWKRLLVLPLFLIAEVVFMTGHLSALKETLFGDNKHA